MKLNLACLAAALLLTSFNAPADNDDFGIWTSVGAEKKITKKLSVEAEADLRLRDDAKSVDRWSFGVDADYKPLKWLKIGAGYSFLYDHNEKTTYKATNGMPNKYVNYWGTRHRFNVSVTGSYKFGNLQLSLRERWQYTYRPEKTVDQRWDFDDEEMDGKPKTYRSKGKNVLRSRVQASYNFRSVRIEPYVNAEMYNAWSIEKMRYTGGADWKITKKHTVGLYYLYQHVYGNDDDNEPNRHVLGVNYKFKF